MKKSLLLSFAMFLGLGLFAQVTLDDFNDGVTTGWAPPADGANFHTYTEANGELKIDFDIQQPTWYGRSTYTFPSPVDMSTNHVIRVAMRTQNLSQTMTVRVDLIDGNTYTSNGVPFDLQPIVADGNIAIYEWSMTNKWYSTFWNGGSGLWTMDSTDVRALEFFVNANGTAGMDSLWLDYIEIDSQFQGSGPGDGDLNFAIDMAGYDGPSFSGVFVNGTFNNWCGSCWPLDDLNGDGVWTGTFPSNPLITYEYLFTVDGWSDQEVLEGANAFNCANGSNNRTVALLGDTTLAFCWESCTDCASDPCVGTTPDPNFITDAECNLNADYNDWEAGWWYLPNPDMSGINTSAGVYSYTKYVNDGIVRAVSREAPLTLTSNNQFKMDVWQNENSNMLVLVQPLDLDTLPTLGNYFDTLTTMGAWSEVNIDMSDNTNSTITGFHFFIGVGDMSTLNAQLFVDNIRLEGYISPQSIEENSIEELSLFPNPATGILNIISQNNAAVSIHDASGRVVLSETVQGTVHTVDVSQLTKGYYLVEVNENGIRRRSKVVIE